MGCNGKIVVPWANLPTEILESIGQCLDTEIDVLRFRAVCKSWRSSTTPLEKFRCVNIKLPYPFQPWSNAHVDAYFTLEERIVYRIEHPDNSCPPNFWLLKVERLSNGKFRILNPASHHQIRILPGITQMPKVLNTLDYRVSEVCKAYALKCMSGDYRLTKKVIYRKGINNDDYCLMAIDSDNNSWYINSGDDKWTMVPSGNYVDIVNLKGQFYGIDPWGRIWELDSMFKSTIFANSTLNSCRKRHLVESDDGNLHLVEEVTGENICTSKGEQNRLTSYLVSIATLGIRIWTLDKKERKWGQADLLNGQIIFAGEDCSFSLSSNEFDSRNDYRVFYTNNCISFQTWEGTKPRWLSDLECDCCSSCQNVVRVYKSFVSSGDVLRRFRGLQGHNTGVSDFQTGKMGSLLMYHEYADIFWPPPSWISRA
ncbi:hypothetical protein ACS0TY_001025 [Phlomoides rotata]